MCILNVAICDDDTVALNSIAGAINGLFEENGAKAVIETFSSADKLKARSEQTYFDLIFLDIEMPGTDGISFGTQLRLQDNSPDIIFVSSREDRVFDTFPLHPFGFVRKSKFLKDISSVVKAFIATKMNNVGSKIVSLPTRNGQVNAHIGNILYFEGNKVYQMMHLKSGGAPVELTTRMEKLEDDFMQYGFMRIHKGYIVNYQHISNITTTEITLSTGQNLPVSRRKTHSVKIQFLEISRKFGTLLF